MFQCFFFFSRLSLTNVNLQKEKNNAVESVTWFFFSSFYLSWKEKKSDGDSDENGVDLPKDLLESDTFLFNDHWHQMNSAEINENSTKHRRKYFNEKDFFRNFFFIDPEKK